MQNTKVGVTNYTRKKFDSIGAIFKRTRRIRGNSKNENGKILPSMRRIFVQIYKI